MAYGAGLGLYVYDAVDVAADVNDVAIGVHDLFVADRALLGVLRVRRGWRHGMTSLAASGLRTVDLRPLWGLGAAVSRPGAAVAVHIAGG